jgi:hypothetical protein
MSRSSSIKITSAVGTLTGESLCIDPDFLLNRKLVFQLERSRIPRSFVFSFVNFELWKITWFCGEKESSESLLCSLFSHAALLYDK